PPTLGIDAVRPLFWNVPGKAAVVLGVRGGRQGEGLIGGVGDEKLLASNAKALAAMPGVNLGGVGLEPGPVPLEALVLRPRLRHLFGAGQFFNDEGDLPGSDHGILLRSPASSYSSAY